MFLKIPILKQAVKKIYQMHNTLEKLERAIGRIENRQIKNVDNFLDAEFQVFSQWGEDGIIQRLISNINISREVFIEFGVEKYMESNTRFLLANNNWSGLVMDGDEDNINFLKNTDFYWQYNLKAVSAFITKDNINELFKKNGIEGKLGILSIDLDGNDYWIWDSINIVDPDIVICEYNYRFGKERAVTVPYDPAFTRGKKHHSMIYFGASIKALTKLANSKGYSLVAGNKNASNLFFVKQNLLNDTIKECTIDAAYYDGQYREVRDKNGNLLFLDKSQEAELFNEITNQLGLVEV